MTITVNALLLQTQKCIRPVGTHTGKRLKSNTMKKDLHPGNYRLVVFKDMSNGHMFLSRSTAASKEKIKFDDGNEYPVIKLEISNTSHSADRDKRAESSTANSPR